MKKVYIPTMDELYQMQDITSGHSMYKYILIKAIESLIIDGINYPNKGILKSAYKYLRENPDIAYAICKLYPEEIKYSEYAKNDINLCLDILNREPNLESNIYSLDNLSHFENGIGVLTNNGVIQTTANILSKELPNNPKYRFEYKQNTLLDDIFDRKIQVEDLAYTFKKDFINIEPAYLLKLEPSKLIKMEPNLRDSYINGQISKILFHAINDYANRYGIQYGLGREYYGQDILTNQDEQVKRLFKCIKEHNKHNR